MGKIAKAKGSLTGGYRIEKSIFARVAKDGRITAFQVKLFASGSKHSICESFESLPEARAYRDSMRADLTLDPHKKRVLSARVEARASMALQGISLDDLLGDYLRTETPKKKGADREVYMIGKMRRFAIVKLPVIALSTGAVRAFMQDLSGAGVGATSVSKYLSTLSAVLKWGRHKLDHPIPNPVLELPAKDRRTVGAARTRRFLADEEFCLRRAIAGMSNGSGQLLPLFDLALMTGARQGELLALKWVDVATDRLLATVRDTKNGDDRQLLLSPDAVKVLERLRSSPVRSLHGRVFGLQRGNVAKLFNSAKKLAREAYLADCAQRGAKPVRAFLLGLRWHDLRREAISTAAETCFAGQLDLQRFSGHREARSLRPYLAMQNDTALARTMPSRAVPARTVA